MALGSIGCLVYTVHFCTTLGSVGFKVSRSQGLGFRGYWRLWKTVGLSLSSSCGVRPCRLGVVLDITTHVDTPW